MPERPARHRQALALGAARIDLDRLLTRRVQAMTAPAAAARPVGQGPEHPTTTRARHLEAMVREFAGQVDRHNDTAQMLAGAGDPLDYAEAVVVTGDRGPVVTDLDTWQHEPIRVEVEAGAVDSVVLGCDVLAYLREADEGAAVALGLD